MGGGGGREGGRKLVTAKTEKKTSYYMIYKTCDSKIVKFCYTYDRKNILEMTNSLTCDPRFSSTPCATIFPN